MHTRTPEVVAVSTHKRGLMRGLSQYAMDLGEIACVLVADPLERVCMCVCVCARARTYVRVCVRACVCAGCVFARCGFF